MKNYVKKYYKFLIGLTPQRNLVYGFLLYNVIGALLLCLPFSRKGDVSFIDTLFTSTSAISTTGLMTVGLTDQFTVFGQFVIMLLFQIGGIGYMTFTTYILLNTSHHTAKWRERILNAAFAIPKTIQLRPFLKSVIIFTILFEIVGTILFYIGFADQEWGFWERLWNSIFHSVSAFCTAGFSLFNSGFVDFVDDGLINFTVSFLAIAGSLGFIIFSDFYLKFARKKHEVSYTSKLILSGFLILLSLGTVAMYFTEPSIMILEGKTRFYASFFQSMTAMTTVGFNTIDNGVMILPVTMITILLMYIGASPSGTSGGLKITTLVATVAYLRSKLKNCKDFLFFNTKIPSGRVDAAVSTFIFYLIVSFFGVLLLTFSEADTLDRIAFEVLSALGTVGLSMGITGGLTFFGKSVIICLMFIGRLGVLTFGLAISRAYVPDEQEAEEEEDIAV
ncbi:potassium transporter TrkH [Nonlabens sp. YIK11]|uniref:TrkH family potassium uptake protein n=1 Tax=Nonlabens sp. YIK11 TaxID=1453349 RepID=UPI0006DC72FF|nr:potassium transporter TrkG [Nonlabens sp. YIK11]KQC32157.1 potassium transporter TrkH [Nonlabens sp. YIK11]